MPDLPAPRAPDPAHVAGSERWEVVVMDVPLGVLGIEGVDHLGHPENSKRRDVEDLRLPPLEQAGTMGARDQPDFTGELANLVRLASVQPDPLGDDASSHAPLLEVLERRGDL